MITNSWKQVKNILIIRADNMGDLIMSSPAIRALKQSFSSRITVLTSSMAAALTSYIAEIDDTIVFDLPWIKTTEVIGNDQISTLVSQLKERRFDAVVIFTVFSQSAMPAAMIAYMAGIPLRLAYSRENPYQLLSHWIPDKEPYTFIQHQVQRDLSLVSHIGAVTDDISLQLNIPATAWRDAQYKLSKDGISLNKQWLVFHPGVSEKKREYPEDLWVEAARKLIKEKGFHILYTGSTSEATLCKRLAQKTGDGSCSIAGLLELHEFIALIEKTRLTVAVNTGPVHICAAVNTPVVVLYAQTNPQHTPWMVPSKVLEFEVKEDNRSKNEVIQFLYKHLYHTPVLMPGAGDICIAVDQLLEDSRVE